MKEDGLRETLKDKTLRTSHKWKSIISEEKINLGNSKVRQFPKIILFTKLSSYTKQSGTFVNVKIYLGL